MITPGHTAVLFDLDGTLVDSAPDLAGALNQLLVEEGRPPIALERARPHTSSGARGMIGAGFGITGDDPAYPALKDRFLDIYQSRLALDSCIFDGVPALLDRLDDAGIPWGIVTNKAMRFTDPLVAALGLAARARVVVSGDTTPWAKPHPAPLLHGAAQLGWDPARCVYVGDDLRDVQAAQAANMRSVVALYGYLGEGLPPEEWGGDVSVGHPLEIADLIRPR
jgi:phosphoglycolate phosphatase